MTEPGRQALERLTITVDQETQQLITKLKHHLEAKGNARLSVSEVLRQGVRCLAKTNGLA